MKPWLRCLLPLALLPLASCSVFHFHSEKPEPTLATLKPARLPEQSRALPQVGLQRVAENYKEVLKNTDDPELRIQVTQRLADLQMLSSEQQQLAGKPDSRYFEDTIKSYQALLAANPHRTDNDKLLYQLSKAYDLDGRGDDSLKVLQQLVKEYPDSAYIVESQFRRGELLFARADYLQAESAYGAVVRRGKGSTYYQNALYMQGWSQFKRNSYDDALVSFTETLDLLWPKGTKQEDLPRAAGEMSNDTLRVMSLIFSYQEGAKSITALYAKMGERHYNAELYRQLGQLYLQQKRYRDAADTYRVYVDAYPLSPQAPAMYVDSIAAYDEGNFPSEVLAEKGAFVKRYGIHSDYFAQSSDDARAPIKEHLKEYLGELAKFNHGEAQRLKSEVTKAGSKADPAQKAAAQQNYRAAGDYYREYIETFPQNPEVGGMVFLLAESRFEAEDYAAAVDAYEQAAYQYPNNEHGAEAGYSAIIAYDQLIKHTSPSGSPDQLNNLEQLKIESELRFASHYAKDPRAVAVQAHAADELFTRKDYAQAVAAATAVLQWQPAAPAPLARSAALIVGHGEFEQQHYAAAEQGYRSAVALIPANDAERSAVQERLAASVYKQGEAQLAAGDKPAAAQQFLRVAQVAPDSNIRVNAQYDAATQFMDGGQWQDAIKVLTDFRTRFPSNALSAGVAAKLAVAYQQTGQLGAAAAELTRVSQQDSDPSVRREALFSAADLYQKAGDNSAAAQTYESYVKAYPQPFAQALEARAQLSDLTAKFSAEQHRYWLAQIISADAQAGSARSDRSRFLAAKAQDELADESYQAFVKVHLTLPIKDSLKLKKAALEQTLAAYNHVLDYGIAQYATKATYRIGEVYSNLSNEILKSERPKELSDLEKEQYEVLLEEQADPFVDKAIAVHEGNVQRSWKGLYDEWVQKSFAALEQLSPARYRKAETKVTASESIY